MEKQVSASEVVARLQARIKSTLADVIPQGPVALLDFPDHSNVGDSAIWLGEMVYLERERGARPVYHCSAGDFSAEDLVRSHPDGPILIHGGGNFGTIWPKHHNFRLDLMRRFKGRPLIQMPQSIHFADDGTVEETRRAIREHGAFTMLVRDRKSQAFAEQHFDCPVHLCPDMAFYIGMTPRKAPVVDFLYLLRTDSETMGEMSVPQTAETREVVDWLGDPRGGIKRARMLGRLKGMIQGGAERRGQVYSAKAWHRYWRGVALLSRGRVVITDRLHSLIISTLLDIPQVALDNSYGKLSSFVAAWMPDLAILRQATTMEDAVVRARELLQKR